MDGGRRTLRVLVGSGLMIGLVAGGTGVVAQEREERSLAEAYFEDGPTPGSGVGRRIGYISLNENIPFVAAVSQGIREQAAVAGVELIECDSRSEADTAILCARQLADLGAEAVLNFQSVAEASGRVCTAHGNLPTIAIDIHQPPCERVFMGADNQFAGRIAGVALGEHLERERDCDYGHVWILEAGQVGRVSLERTNGMQEGFESVCGAVPEERLHRLDVQGLISGTLELFTPELAAVSEAGVQVVLTINDDTARGAEMAAASLGRTSELRIASQGADTTLTELACEPHWIVSTAYFSERYGNILIPAVLDLLEGEDVPQDLFVPHEAVTGENIVDIYGVAPDCTAA